MVARKKIVEDQELKKLVLKLKKQKKPTWKELKSQGNWEVNCSAEDIWGKSKKK